MLSDRPDDATRSDSAMQRGSAGGGLILAVVADLVFGSKISGTARAVGVHAQIVRSWRAAQVHVPSAAALLIDLQLSDEDALDAIRAARAAAPKLRILAFCSHVQKERMDAASAAGAHEVLPRSRFTAGLADILLRLARSDAG